MEAKRWSIEHAGRRIAVEPVSTWSGRRARLLVDGEAVAEETTGTGKRLTLEGGGVTVRTWLSWTGEGITRAELVTAGEPLPLAPAPGTFAARREDFARRHPAIAASQHAFGGVAKVLIGLVGVSFLLRLLPEISIDLPLPDLPSIALPLPSIDVDLPEISLPAWLEAMLNSSKYWGPILAGCVYAIFEYRRRRRQRDAGDRA